MLVIWKKIKLDPYHTLYIRMEQGYETIQVQEETFSVGKGPRTMTQTPDVMEKMINNIV